MQKKSHQGGIFVFNYLLYFAQTSLTSRPKALNGSHIHKVFNNIFSSQSLSVIVLIAKQPLTFDLN